ncbi:MAG: 2-hydroxyacid dehydrogenase [Dysgonomonas sp.]
MTHKVTVFSTQNYELETIGEVNEDFGFDLNFRTERLDVQNAFLAKDSEALAIGTDLIDAELIDKLQALGVKIIALRSAGFNNVDLKAAADKIKIVRVPAYSPHAIAEHAVGLMLSLNRKIHRAYWRTKDDNFSTEGFMGFDMYQKTAGVIGTGKIGKAVAQLLRGFGMEVLCYDVYPDNDFIKSIGAKYVSQDELYANSDIITLHCPLTKDSEYMICDESIEKMKNGVMLINTGRGKLVNTKHLIDALISGKVGYAGLDVYEEEENYFNRDLSNQILKDNTLARILSFNNVIVTSHQAYFTKEAVINIAETTLQNIDDFFNGKQLVNEVAFKEK